MTDASDVRHMLHEADMMHWGPELRTLLAEAVAAAQSLGDEELEYGARMRQTAAFNMSGDIAGTLASFSWCLAQHDADPVRFPSEVDGNDLLWHFKWMAGLLRVSPEFSNEQIDAVLDDMEAHYQRAGVGLSGVYMARFESAWSRGDLEKAEEYRLLLDQTPEDDYSHCDACVRSQVAGFLIDTDRPYDGIHLVDEMVDGGFTCAEEPEHALSRALIPLLRAGRTDDARAAHLRSYRLAQADPDKLGIIALHLEFLAITGNEARALTMIERHLPWLGHDALNASSHAVALAAIALAAEAIAAAGHGDLEVRGSDDVRLARILNSTGLLTVSQLADVAGASAESIAARFDARNGTDAFSQRIAGIRALREEHFDLRVSGETFHVDEQAAPTATPEARYDRALNLAVWGDSIAAIPAAEAALADNIPEHASRLHGIIVGAHGAREDWAAAEAALPPVIAALRAEGEDVRALLEEDLGLALYGRTTPEDLAGLREAALRTDLPGRARADIALALASHAMESDDVSASASHAQEAVDAYLSEGLLDRADDVRSILVTIRASAGDDSLPAAIEALLESPHLCDGGRARVLALRARMRGANGDFEDAAADADASSRIAVALGVRENITTVFYLAGMLLQDAEDYPAAATRYRAAVRYAEMENNPQLLTIRYQLAIALLNMGESDEAADILTDVLITEEDLDVDKASRAQTATALAQALEAANRPLLDVGGSWLLAAQLYAEVEDRLMQAQSHLHAGRVLSRAEHVEWALEQFDIAVLLASELDDQDELLARSLHMRGQAKGNAGDESALDDFTQALMLATTVQAEWLAADIVDSRGRVLGQRGDHDQAVASLLQASDAFMAAGDPDAAAGSELYAARVLAATGRPADSVPLFRAAVEHTTDATGLRQAAAIELGDMLAGLGRHAEAAEARRLADQA